MEDEHALPDPGGVDGADRGAGPGGEIGGRLDLAGARRGADPLLERRLESVRGRHAPRDRHRRAGRHRGRRGTRGRGDLCGSARLLGQHGVGAQRRRAPRRQLPAPVVGLGAPRRSVVGRPASRRGRHNGAPLGGPAAPALRRPARRRGTPLPGPAVAAAAARRGAGRAAGRNRARDRAALDAAGAGRGLPRLPCEGRSACGRAPGPLRRPEGVPVPAGFRHAPVGAASCRYGRCPRGLRDRECERGPPTGCLISGDRFLTCARASSPSRPRPWSVRRPRKAAARGRSCCLPRRRSRR